MAWLKPSKKPLKTVQTLLAGINNLVDELHNMVDHHQAKADDLGHQIRDLEVERKEEFLQRDLAKSAADKIGALVR